MSSLAARIRAEVEGRIRSGEWAPGARIPTEHALMAAYGCARMTVHKAISDLVTAGLVERRRKAGSFVAVPHVQTAVIEIPDIAAIIRARGEAYSFELIARALRPAEAGRSLASPAGFDMAGDTLVLDGLHVAQDRPFCLEHRTISLAAAPAAAAADFSAISPGSWLLDHIPWSQGRHRIAAVAAGAGAKHLGVSRTAACLQVDRWTWKMAQPVTFVRQLFAGDRYELIAAFEPSARP